MLGGEKVAMTMTIEQERNNTWARLRAESQAREQVTYLAYGVAFGDSKALAHAQRTRKPSTVPVRMPGGLLENFYPELAVAAILNGGKLETRVVGTAEVAATIAPGEFVQRGGVETRVTHGGRSRRG